MKPEIEFAQKINNIIVEGDIPPEQALWCLTKICMAMCTQASPEEQQALLQAMAKGLQAGLDLAKQEET
jgi:hypothetical protein